MSVLQINNFRPENRLVVRVGLKFFIVKVTVRKFQTQGLPSFNLQSRSLQFANSTSAKITLSKLTVFSKKLTNGLLH